MALQSFSHRGNDGKYSSLDSFRCYEHICAQGFFWSATPGSDFVSGDFSTPHILTMVLCLLANAANNVSHKSDPDGITSIIFTRKLSSVIIFFLDFNIIYISGKIKVCSTMRMIHLTILPFRCYNFKSM